MITCTVSTEHWDLHVPFRIAGASMNNVPVIFLELEDRDGFIGRGEAAGIDYEGETPASMTRQIESMLHHLHDDITPNDLMQLLPRGGARNALDCALWDLLSKQTGKSAARRAGLPPLRPLTTAMTIGLGDDSETRYKARAAKQASLLKIKVDGHRHLDAIRIVRQENPLARLIIDANGSWSRELLEILLPELVTANIVLIEQPLAPGDDASLERLNSPIPLAADESCTDTQSLDALVNRYQYVNIKLDKCGGLTEALRMTERAKVLGFELMVGNMCGSSLAMAPAFLIGQRCHYVDLDGPQLQQHDRAHPMRCEKYVLYPPEPELWG